MVSASRIPRVLTSGQWAFWNDNGYLVLPKHFRPEQMQAVLDEVQQFWDRSRHETMRTVADIYIGTPNEKRVRLHDAPDDARNKAYKLNDLFLESNVVQNLVLEDRLARILAELIEGEPLCCNSLNFEYGSQQAYHTDSIFMTPPHKLHLAATWIALEDCQPDAGPLRYYPGSHKIEPFVFSTGSLHFVLPELPKYHEYMANEVVRLNLKEEVFCAKTGDVFIWHSQLFHGGSPILNPGRTRKSLVTHYFRAEDLPCEMQKVGEVGYLQVRDPQPVN
jgi:hypothetical protein